MQKPPAQAPHFRGLNETTPRTFLPARMRIVDWFPDRKAWAGGLLFERIGSQRSLSFGKIIIPARPPFVKAEALPASGNPPLVVLCSPFSLNHPARFGVCLPIVLLDHLPGGLDRVLCAFLDFGRQILGDFVPLAFHLLLQVTGNARA